VSGEDHMLASRRLRCAGTCWPSSALAWLLLLLSWSCSLLWALSLLPSCTCLLLVMVPSTPEL
jgi:hypothetical protein